MPYDDATFARPGLTFARLRLSTALTKAAAGGSWQPRDSHGKWTAGGFGGGGGFKPAASPLSEAKLVTPQYGQGGAAVATMTGDPGGKVFTKPLTQSEATGKPPHLGNPLGLVVQYPDKPTAPFANRNPNDMAVFTHEQAAGPALNGVPFDKWAGPQGGDWTKVDGTGSFDEPVYPKVGGKRLGAGVVIEEPDGRIWTVAPTNGFGGYNDTLPKGGIEEGLDLRQTAIKEAFEESGLKVELTGYLGDFTRTTSVARYYKARRVGGDPTAYHWETQATKLVPKNMIDTILVHPADKPLAAMIQGKPVVAKALDAHLLLRETMGQDEPLGDVIVGKAWTSSKGWQKQPRVPNGFATGGQWTKGAYGSGTIGQLYAENGAALDLQLIPKWDDPNPHPQVVKYSDQIRQIEKEANAGVLSAETLALAGEPQPKNGYKAKAWANAKEAVAYVAAKAASPQPTPKVEPDMHPAKIGGAAAAAAGVTTGTYTNPLDIEAMTKVGAKPGGSALGAIYEDADGTRWLVKAYTTEQMALNEVAAARIYQAMGVGVPEMKLVDLKGAHGMDHLGVASRMIDDLQPMSSKPKGWMLKEAQADFGAHALMANWDSIGASYDNTMFSKTTGQAVMVDPGGALLFRAQGEPKGAKFGAKVVETTTMRGLDPNTPVSAGTKAVYGKMSQSDLIASYDKALQAYDNAKAAGTIDKIIMDSFGDTPMAKNLIAKLDDRSADLAKQFESLEAAQKSTTGLNTGNFGTTTSLKQDQNPQVAQAANLNLTAKNFDEAIEAHKSVIGTALGKYSGADADFYVEATDMVYTAMMEGDMQGLNLSVDEGGAFYIPTSPAVLGSTNYSMYLDAVESAKKAMILTQAKKLKADPSTVDQTAWVTGKTVQTSADVQGAKAVAQVQSLRAQQAEAQQGGTMPGLGDPAYDVSPSDPAFTDGSDADPAPKNNPGSITPKQAAPDPADVPPAPSPLPPLPDKPQIATASNPATSLVAKADLVETIAKSGAPDAIAQIQAIAGTLPQGGGNSLTKKFANYLADTVASLGGEPALMAIPFPKKVAAGVKALQKVGAINAGDLGAVPKNIPAPDLTPIKQAPATAINTDGSAATGKPKTKVISVEEVGGFKVTTTESRIEFNPANLQPPPDFYNWHGPGKPLSTKPHLNADNQKVSQELFDAAKTGDVAKVMAVAVPVPENPEAAKHVKFYKQTLIDELNAVGQKQLKTEYEGDGSPDKMVEVVAKTAASIDFGKPGVTKIANMLVTGEAGQAELDLLKAHVFDKGKVMAPGNGSNSYETFIANSKQVYDAAKSTVQNLAKSFTGSAYIKWNGNLRGYAEDAASLDKSLKAGKAFQDLAVEIPAGTVLLRGVTSSAAKGLTVEALKAAKGKVLQDHGITSTSFGAQAAFGGDIQFRFVTTEGTKAVFAKHFSSFSGENEITLPPNYRMLILDVKDGATANQTPIAGIKKVDASKTVVEVLLLPQDDATLVAAKPKKPKT